jgi:hypothetical protein
MRGPLAPFSNIVAPGALQAPNGPVRIDWQHRLANGLIGCVIPSMTVNELTGNLPNASTPGSYLAVSNADGSGGGISPSSFTLPAISPFRSWTSITQAIRFSVIDVGGAYYNVISLNYSQPNVAPYNVASLSAGATNYPTGLLLVWNSAGGQNSRNVGLGLSVGQIYSVVTVFTIGGTNFVYFNGSQVFSTAWSGSGPNFTPTSFWSVGQNPSIAVNVAYAWNRALSAEEILSLHLNPYDLLIPEEHILPIETTVAGPAFNPAWVKPLNQVISGGRAT